MLKPFYQGKLDSFCALYAVLNALRLTHGIRGSKARDIFNTTLMGLCARPAAFQAVLRQDTDYMDLVDGMLQTVSCMMPLAIVCPFRQETEVDVFWRVCREWLNPGGQRENGRAIVFRFMRYITPEKAPLNRHWTTADKIDDKILHLFDCSHEAEAILNIRKESIVTRQQSVDKEHLVYVQPNSVRLLRLPV